MGALVFDVEVGLDVGVGGAGLFVAEPEGDDLEGDAGVEQVHGGRMSPDVRGDLTAVEGRTGLFGLANGQIETESNALAGQGDAMAIGEEGLVGLKAVGLDEAPKSAGHLRLERDGAFLASFSVEGNKAALYSGGVEVEDLGNTGAGLVKEAEKQVVALAEARGKIDGIQDGGDLAPVHEPDNGLDRALARDGHDAPRGRQPMRGRLTDGKAGEGSQRRQAGVAGSCRVVARALQMVEKGEDRIGIQVFELELVDGFAAMFGQESQQQPESVSVGADGVDAEVALSAEVVAEKAFDKGGKGVHEIKDWVN